MSRRATTRSGPRLRRILHPTDFSAASRPAFRMALGRVLLGDVLSKPRQVDPHGERVTVARAIGTIFGDEGRLRART